MQIYKITNKNTLNIGNIFTFISFLNRYATLHKPFIRNIQLNNKRISFQEPRRILETRCACLNSKNVTNRLTPTGSDTLHYKY